MCLIVTRDDSKSHFWTYFTTHITLLCSNWTRVRPKKGPPFHGFRQIHQSTPSIIWPCSTLRRRRAFPKKGVFKKLQKFLQVFCGYIILFWKMANKTSSIILSKINKLWLFLQTWPRLRQHYKLIFSKNKTNFLKGPVCIATHNNSLMITPFKWLWSKKKENLKSRNIKNYEFWTTILFS